MQTETLRPHNTEEALVWYALVLGYVFYLSGTLYVVGSLVGWAIAFVVVLRLLVLGKAPKHACIPVVVWVWIFGMLAMLLALLMGHADYDLSTGQTIKSSIGWAKGWALMALILVLGSVASIRPEIIVRATCMLSAQATVFGFLGVALAVVGFQGQLFLSPLKVIGGPISSFEVGLFGLNPETGLPRWPFFAPWAPAAGLLSCLFLLICSQESNIFWRRAGFLGALVMCILSQSRAGWALFIGLIPTLYLMKYLRNPVAIFCLGLAMTSAVVLSEPLIERVSQAHQDIKEARPDSTRVRAALATIAVQRWEAEAPIWGHGILERGPKMVEFMPIGSHHSWYGLLFVKGIVGLVALAIPMAFTVLYLLVLAPGSRKIQVGLLIMLVLTGYSFFENLEILAYLYWPALLWLGITLNPMKLHHIEPSYSGAKL